MGGWEAKIKTSVHLRTTGKADAAPRTVVVVACSLSPLICANFIGEYERGCHRRGECRNVACGQDGTQAPTLCCYMVPMCCVLYCACTSGRRPGRISQRLIQPDPKELVGASLRRVYYR